MVYNALKLLMSMNPSLFEKCASDYQAACDSEEARMLHRKAMWENLEQLAKQKSLHSNNHDIDDQVTLTQASYVDTEEIQQAHISHELNNLSIIDSPAGISEGTVNHETHPAASNESLTGDGSPTKGAHEYTDFGKTSDESVELTGAREPFNKKARFSTNFALHGRVLKYCQLKQPAT